MLFSRVGRGALTRGCGQKWLVESRLEGSYSPAPRGMGLASLDFWVTVDEAQTLVPEAVHYSSLVVGTWYLETRCCCVNQRTGRLLIALVYLIPTQTVTSH